MPLVRQGDFLAPAADAAPMVAVANAARHGTTAIIKAPIASTATYDFTTPIDFAGPGRNNNVFSLRRSLMIGGDRLTQSLRFGAVVKQARFVGMPVKDLQ
jgi:hypothetical protein